MRRACPFERPSAAPSARRWTGRGDVLICGASFAGLAVARELRRQRRAACSSSTATRSASARPRRARPRRRGWRTSASHESIRQTFRELVVHTPSRSFRWRLPWTFSTFDYRHAVRAAARPGRRLASRRRRSTGARGLHRPHRPRRPERAARRRRARLAARAVGAERGDPAARGAPVARPGGPPAWRRRRPRAVARPLLRARGLLVELPGRRRAARRRRLVRPARPRQGADRAPGRRPRRRRRPLPGQLDPPPDAPPRCEDGVFFVGDSAGHCLPTTAEGIRTALYFGLACGRELRAVVEGRQDARAGARALRRVLRRARSRRSAGCCACRTSSRA